LAEKSAISFMTALFTFLVLLPSKLPFTCPSVAFAMVLFLTEKIAQWEAFYLPGWMAVDVADARWSRPRHFYGQPSFELTSVGRRSSGW
jgi:hypothetical protein